MLTSNASPWTRRTCSGGFTLTEILVAVAVVGVLAAIAFVQYQNQAMRARVAAALEFTSESRTRVALDLAQDRNTKTDLLKGGPVNDIVGLVWYPGKSGDPVTGYILATLNLPGQGTRNAFALELKQGVWQCVSAARYADPATTLDNDYLPAACRDGAAPITAQANGPGGSGLDVTSACTDGDPGGFKSKTADAAKPQSCTSGTASSNVVAAPNRGGSTTGPDATAATGGTGASIGSNNSTGSESGAAVTGPGGDTGVDRATVGAAAAVSSDKAGVGAGAAAGSAAQGAAANNPTQGAVAGSSENARGLSPGGGTVARAGLPGTTGGSTTGSATSAATTPPAIVCGQYFEFSQNTCALAGSPAPRVCRSEKENCEQAHVTGADCPALQPFAANVVENLSDGSHYVSRRCLSLREAFLGVKKNRETAACASYDPGKAVSARFTCVFPCYGNDCNRSVVPEDPATRLTWENDIVDSANGRKRAKNDADLPDIFDTWTCPKGTIPDKMMTGRCIRPAPAAVAKDAKAAEGAAPKR